MIHRDTEVNHLYTLNFCEIFANLKKMPKTMYSGQSHCTTTEQNSGKYSQNHKLTSEFSIFVNFAYISSQI